MKKLVSVILCLCLILSTFTFVGISASAEEYEATNVAAEEKLAVIAKELGI